MEDIRWMARRRFAQALNPQQCALFLALSGPDDARDFLKDAREQATFEGYQAALDPAESTLMAAVEYALGRSSTSVLSARNAVLDRLQDLSLEFKERLVAVVEEAISSDKAGMRMDVHLWTEVRDAAVTAMSVPTP